MDNYFAKKTDTNIMWWLFISVFFISGIVLLSTGYLLSPFDPLYHIAQAEAMWNGVNLPLPTLSFYENVQPQPRFVFHALLAPFTHAFGTTPAEIIVGVKVGYSILISGFIVLLYYIYKQIFNTTLHNITVLAAKKYAVFAILFTFLPLSFVYRAFMFRPQIISILVILLSVLFLLQKNWKGLFITALLYPFLYSAVFLIIIPPVVYTCTSLLISYFQDKSQITISPISYTLGGILLGIIVRPSTLSYIQTVIINPILTLIYRFIPLISLPAGSELFFPSMGTFDWLLLFFTITITGVIGMYISDKRKIPESLNLNTLFLLLLANIFAITFIFVGRTIEYFAPLAVILIFVIYNNVYRSLLTKIKNSTFFQEEYPGVFKLCKEIRNDVLNTQFRAKMRKTLIASLLVFVALNLSSIPIQSNKGVKYTDYHKAAMSLQYNSNSGDVVFHEGWSHYPGLVFFNKKNRYIMGMDPIQTYQFDREKYWLWYHITHSKHVCPQYTCNKTTVDLDKVIRDTFNAKYLFATKKLDTERNSNSLLQKLQDNSDFQKISSHSHDKLKTFVYKVRTL